MLLPDIVWVLNMQLLVGWVATFLYSLHVKGWIITLVSFQSKHSALLSSWWKVEVQKLSQRLPSCCPVSLGRRTFSTSFEPVPTPYPTYSLTCEGNPIGAHWIKFLSHFPAPFQQAGDKAVLCRAVWPTTHGQELHEKSLCEPGRLLLWDKFNIFCHAHPLKTL